MSHFSVHRLGLEIVGGVAIWIMVSASGVQIDFPASAATALATLAVTPPTKNANSLLIWWPGSLSPTEKTPASDALHSQLERYQTAHDDLTINIRVKRPDGIGGIFQTLRSGYAVAESAMPDLTLLRRDDLVQAVANKLIQPISPAPVGDLLVDSLGTVGDTLYGVPYTLEIQHFVYHNAALTTAPKTPDDLINAKLRMLFPSASLDDGLLFDQYTAAGGHIISDKGTPMLDAAPLKETLNIYERALNAKLLEPGTLDYSGSTQYWPQFLTDNTAVAQIDSTTFLGQRGQLSDVGVMPLPTLDGMPITAVDGWMWVIVTTDPDRAAKALDLATWLLQTDNQAEFTRLIGVLPSRQSALKAWKDDHYATFAATLLGGRIAPFPDMTPAIVADALHKALESVLSGHKSAEAAANDAVNQVAAAGGR